MHDAEQAHSAGCPYCGEMLDLLLDLSAGSQHYIEDCQVCCQPIEVHLQVDAQGDLAGLQLHRDDDA